MPYRRKTGANRYSMNGVVSCLQVGSCGLNSDQRDALDQLGLAYERGELTLQQAATLGKEVRLGEHIAVLRLVYSGIFAEKPDLCAA